MKIIFKIVVGFAALVLFSQCKPRSAASEVETTSDRLKEQKLVVKGVLQIPLDVNAHLLAHMIDLMREKIDYPLDQAVQERVGTALTSVEALRANFNETYKKAWPLVDDKGEVDKAKVLFWISRQLQYPNNLLKRRSIDLAMSKTDNVLSETFENDGKNLTVRYSVYAYAAVSLDKGVLKSEETQLRVGDKLTIPRNMLDTYWNFIAPMAPAGLRDTVLSSKMSGEVWQDLQDKIRAMINSIRDEKNAASLPCLADLASHSMSPFNLFFFFNPVGTNCLKNAWSVPITEISEVSRTKTYPEYHMLFGPRPTNIFIYYGIVSGNISATRNLVRYLLSQGYQVKDFSLDPAEETTVVKNPKIKDITNTNFIIKQVKLIKRVNTGDINVTIAFQERFPEARQMLRQAIKDDDVVIYSGHAGFGASIDEAFTDINNFSERHYQILMLDGCSTYRYGVSSVMMVKALRDLDVDNHYIDVMATVGMLTGSGQIIPFLQALERGANLWNKPASTWTAKDRSELSWLGIITAMNATIDKVPVKDGPNAFYLVSGEQKNLFAPGRGDLPANDDKPQNLLAFAEDPAKPMEFREKAAEVYLTLEMQKPDVVSRLEDFKGQVTSLYKLGLTIDSVPLHPSGIPRSLQFNSQDPVVHSIGDCRFDFSQHTKLNESGTIGSGSLVEPCQTSFPPFGKVRIEGDSSDSRRVEFLEDGTLAKAVIRSPLSMPRLYGGPPLQAPVKVVSSRQSNRTSFALEPAAALSFVWDGKYKCRFDPKEAFSVPVFSSVNGSQLSGLKLEQCKVSEPVSAWGKRFGGIVTLNPTNGLLRSGYTSRDEAFAIDDSYFGVSTVFLRSGQLVRLDETGRALRGVLARDAGSRTIGGVKINLSADSLFILDQEGGNTWFLSLKDNAPRTTLRSGAKCVSDYLYTFYRGSNALASCRLEDEFSENGFTCSAGSVLHFDQKGKPTNCEAEEDDRH